MNKMRLALPGVLALLLVAKTTVPATAASTQLSTHSIEYHVGCGQAMIWDGSLD